VKAQQLPTETVIAPPAIEEEEIPKKTGRGHAGVPELEAPSVASEKKPPNLPLGRDAGSSDSQDFVAPLAPTAESPTAADPGDIIDWLIQKKHTGEKLNRQVPHQRQPASE
jgi:hypothetical protein